jgi:UDP-glucose 4-epimerase
MAKVAVTGSAGLIGSNLTKKLVSLGHDVIGIDLATGCDLTNEKQTDEVFELVRPEVVYALAAEAAESRGQASPVYMTQNNSGIFVNTLKASINAGVKKFIFTSSVAVYGEVNVPYKEDGPTKPKDVYGVNKLACEQMLKIMAKVHGFTYVIFRPHNIYGPGQNMRDPYKNVIALFMRRLVEKQPYVLYGFGEMRRAFSFVDDVIGVLAEALDPKFDNQTLNVGSEKDISIKELSDLVQKVTGIRSEVEMLKGRPQEISMFLADHTKQKQLTHYHETPIEKGLKKTWDWVKNRPLLPIIQKRTEICSGQK